MTIEMRPSGETATQLAAHLADIERRIIALEKACGAEEMVIALRASRRLMHLTASARNIHLPPQRRAEDVQRLSRAQWAGLGMAIIAMMQGGIAMASVSETIHAVFEATASGLLFLGGAVLVLVRDPRCQPKIDRFNALLFRKMEKELGLDTQKSSDDQS